MATSLPITNDEREQRFMVELDGEVAELVYLVRGHRLLLIHTEVPDAFEGRGVGGALVKAAVDYAVEHQLTVEPRCPFARGWLERHPEEGKRVVIDWSAPDSTRSAP
jgi:predicted GNAT family acetyltransferase